MKCNLPDPPWDLAWALLNIMAMQHAGSTSLSRDNMDATGSFYQSNYDGMMT